MTAPLTAQQLDARARALGFVLTSGGWRHPVLAPNRVVKPVRNPITGAVLRRCTLWRLRRVHRDLADARMREWRRAQDVRDGHRAQESRR